MSILIAAIIGLAAGTHTSTWGMYKDAAHEGFAWRKYLRSILISGIIAPVLNTLGVSVTSVGEWLLLFGVTYVLERAVSEFHKTFLRNEDQSKYFIPMQLAVRGRVVQSRRARAMAGVAVAIVAVLLAVLVTSMQSQGRPDVSRFVIAGSLAGLFCACGGAWKDAPIEGFETFKFFRSPAIAAAFSVLLSAFTDVLLLAALAGLGFSIATLETYKTFFFPSKPRGKFAGKAIRYPEMLTRRQWFVPVYVSICVLLIAGFFVGA